jgi:hypothetical protein
MNSFWASTIAVCGLACVTACSSTDEPSKPKELTSAVAYDLDDIKTNPTPYDWFDFRPNIKKLILAGVAESQHIAILWYTVTDGGVALHYHAKTESVYVVDGTQTDAKGTYPTGTVYFNPPGSGHQVTDSTGFFLLAYSAPPDFGSTDLIGEYEPARIDTTDPELTTTYPFVASGNEIDTFTVPLDSQGGLSAQFVEATGVGNLTFSANYLLVLKGSCDIEGLSFGEQKLIVTKTVEPDWFELTATKDRTCLAMSVSF